MRLWFMVYGCRRVRIRSSCAMLWYMQICFFLVPQNRPIFANDPAVTSSLSFPLKVMGIPERVWAREEVAAAILKGQNLVIYRDLLLRIPHSWLAHHPGGDLAILHFVGRDASDEIEAYHAPETLQMLLRYTIGRVSPDQDGWSPFVPPLMAGWRYVHFKNGQASWVNEASSILLDGQSKGTSELLLVEKTTHDNVPVTLTREILNPPPTALSRNVQKQLSLAYKALHKRVIDEGLYDTPYITGYGPEITRYLLFAATSAWAYSNGWFITSAVFLGFFWHQLTFAAHDLGHVGVTHNWFLDRLLGVFIADFLGGLSLGWWVNVRVLAITSQIVLLISMTPRYQNHNVHHREYYVCV